MLAMQGGLAQLTSPAAIISTVWNLAAVQYVQREWVVSTLVTLATPPLGLYYHVTEKGGARLQKKTSPAQLVPMPFLGTKQYSCEGLHYHLVSFQIILRVWNETTETLSQRGVWKHG